MTDDADIENALLALRGHPPVKRAREKREDRPRRTTQKELDQKAYRDRWSEIDWGTRRIIPGPLGAYTDFLISGASYGIAGTSVEEKRLAAIRARENYERAQTDPAAFIVRFGDKAVGLSKKELTVARAAYRGVPDGEAYKKYAAAKLKAGKIL